MSKLFSADSSFQKSINIAYDLNNTDRLKSFIPTNAFLELLERILKSCNPKSDDRAHILIGAYGKGKSHIVLMLLSILKKVAQENFPKLINKINKNETLKKSLHNYYKYTEGKILPVIISGNYTSLSQAFLFSLERALKDNNLDIMPETCFHSAIKKINYWKQDYPDTFSRFKELIDAKYEVFINDLKDYKQNSYRKFEEIYPVLSAGDAFNPLHGMCVVDLYESVAKSIKSKGYSGLYVVYDEFSKYLEANIVNTSVSDTKMLQDFAEKCNRSGDLQLHLLLISHKDISNYIDKLPKAKMDGWRGISGRFSHEYLVSNYSQTNEIISSTINKELSGWAEFQAHFAENFREMHVACSEHTAFSEYKDKDFDVIVNDCYPLHPISGFLLPRLSEKIAQNERTMFTFLSAMGSNTLQEFLDGHDDNCFEYLTPDFIYDYFEPLFKREIYDINISHTYKIASRVLVSLDNNSLEAKIIKTIALICMLELYDKLRPTKDEIIFIFKNNYPINEISSSIERLIEEKLIVYLRRSNGYLLIKENAEVDTKQLINDEIEKQKTNLKVKEILNQINFDSYIYPSRYNIEKEMTRYFSFRFIEGNEVTSDVNWEEKSNYITADENHKNKRNDEPAGYIFAVIPSSEDNLIKIREIITEKTKECHRQIFIVPNNYADVEQIIREFYAVTFLRDQAIEDKTLFNEYDLIYDDLKEIIINIIFSYSHPEKKQVSYYYKSKIQSFFRKTDLSNLISDICENLYPKTPVIPNESLNRMDLTSIAASSRGKIISALLRNELEDELGLKGSGQEISMMRSSLYETELLVNKNGVTSLNLDNCRNDIKPIISYIEAFVLSAKNKKQCFSELYDGLIGPSQGIGLKKGIIPIFLAAVLHKYKKQAVVSENLTQIVTNEECLRLIDNKPSGYYLNFVDWNETNDNYVVALEEIFKDNIISVEKNNNSYDYIVNALRRWYLSLAKYAVDSKRPLGKKESSKQRLSFIKLLKTPLSNHVLLFEKIPQIFDCKKLDSILINKIKKTKAELDSHISDSKLFLQEKVKQIFNNSKDELLVKKSSLTSVIKDWCESISPNAFIEVFPDNTTGCLKLFKSITNNTDQFIEDLVRLVTGLRIDDWDDTVYETFEKNLLSYKKTAEDFKEINKAIENNERQLDDGFELTFVDEAGNQQIKHFPKVVTGQKAKLLTTSILSDLESMGHTVSVHEKRQVLLEILRGLC